jgi:hypothetical protein
MEEKTEEKRHEIKDINRGVDIIDYEKRELYAFKYLVIFTFGFLVLFNACCYYANPSGFTLDLAELNRILPGFKVLDYNTVYSGVGLFSIGADIVDRLSNRFRRSKVYKFLSSEFGLSKSDVDEILAAKYNGENVDDVIVEVLDNNQNKSNIKM